mgnify:CR=1 FL=1
MKSNATNLKDIYKLIGRAYDISTVEGSRRIERVRENIVWAVKELDLKLNGESFILALCAGSGPEAIVLSEVYGCRVLCIDVQGWLLEKCNVEVKRRRLNVECICSDAKLIGSLLGRAKFDGATIWGCSLGHLSIKDFDTIASSVRELIVDGGFILIEQSDHVFGLLQRYEKAFVESRNPPVVSFHLEFNPVDGYWKRLVVDFSTGEVTEYVVYVWSPWIIKYVLEKNGFSEVKVLREKYGGSYVIVGFKM